MYNFLTINKQHLQHFIPIKGSFVIVNVFFKIWEISSITVFINFSSFKNKSEKFSIILEINSNPKHLE